MDFEHYVRFKKDNVSPGKIKYNGYVIDDATPSPAKRRPNSSGDSPVKLATATPANDLSTSNRIMKRDNSCKAWWDYSPKSKKRNKYANQYCSASIHNRGNRGIY